MAVTLREMLEQQKQEEIQGALLKKKEQEEKQTLLRELLEKELPGSTTPTPPIPATGLNPEEERAQEATTIAKDMALDLMKYGMTTSMIKRLARTVGGKASNPWIRGASIMAGPLVEAVEGAVERKDPIETLGEMGEAALWGFGLEKVGGPALGWMFRRGKGAVKMHQDLARELTNKAVDLPAFKPLQKLFPNQVHGESLRELFQPVIERAEYPLKRVLEKKELITDVARQAIAETSKRMEALSLEERYHAADLIKGSRFTPARGLLTSKFKQLPLDSKQRITHALAPMEKWKLEAGKIDPGKHHFRELDLLKQIEGNFVKKLGQQGHVLDPDYLDELLPFIQGKGGVEQARKAFTSVIEHPGVSEEAKMLAKDLYLLHHTVAETLPSAVQHVEKGLLFHKLKMNPKWVSPTPKPGMVEATHPTFKGLYVTRDVNQAIKEYEAVPAMFTRAVNTYFMTPWKMSKVVWRVPAHFRNMMSNTILNDMGGLPFYRLDIYKRALHDIRHNSVGTREFARMSGVGTTFMETEVAPFIRKMEKASDMLQVGEIYTSHLQGLTQKGVEKSLHALGKGMQGAATAGKAFGRLYQMEETWFKYAKYLHNLEQGMNKKEAVEDAVKWTFNYGRVTPLVRTMRETFAPFATWTTKAIPLVYDTAIEHPLRVAKWGMLPYVMTQLANETSGFSEEEWESARDMMPDYISKGLIGLAPWRDEYGRAQLINFSWFMPGIGDLASLYAGSGSPASVVQTLTQNPLISIAADLKHNRTLGGAPIYYDWEPTSLKLGKLAMYGYMQLAPGIISIDVKKALDTFSNRPDAPAPSQVFLNAFGVPVIPIVPRELERKRAGRLYGAQREMKYRMRRELMEADTQEAKEKVRSKYRRMLEGYIEKERGGR